MPTAAPMQKITHLNTETAPRAIAALDDIPQDAVPIWGKMNATELFVHLRTLIEISLGELDPPDESTFVTRSPLFRKMLLVMPLPKGKIKGPKFLNPAPEGDHQAEKRMLAEAINRFVETAEKEPKRIGRSPVFGEIELQEWTRLQGWHFDYHFEQFGLR